MTTPGYIGVAIIGCGILQIVTFPLWVWFGQRTTRGTAFPWEKARHRSRARSNETWSSESSACSRLEVALSSRASGRRNCMTGCLAGSLGGAATRDDRAHPVQPEKAVDPPKEQLAQ